jgi:hypothetical protein
MEASAALSKKLKEDLSDMEKKLSLYVDKGRMLGAAEIREESIVAIKPDVEKIKPLERVSDYDGQFLAVDCSTRTLKRANNWGVYLMRPSYVIVKNRKVEWGYEERMCTAVGDAYARRHLLEDCRLELESNMALHIVDTKLQKNYDGHTGARRDYVLLDGGSYFGGESKFRVSLYDKCKEAGLRLLAVSKNSPILHDEKGRDFLATTGMLSSHPTWVYASVKKANRDEHLYGDICAAKLCGESARVFRCDVMEYLSNCAVEDLLSPLTFLSEDPRCLGYPIPLFLAHEFSAPSETMLLHHLDEIEKTLRDAGIFDILRCEEFSCSFADELHGVRYAFNREMLSDYV